MRNFSLVLAIFLAACSRTEPSKNKSESVSSGPAKILVFYASPPAVEEGESTLLCYGTENADWVKLDPPVEELKPALSRCFAVYPKSATKYTLSVQGASQTVEVKTLPRDKRERARQQQVIRLFVADLREASPGQTVTLCYGVADAKTVKLEPGGRTLPPLERSCFQEQVRQTTEYKLTAIGVNGVLDSQTLTIRVR